MRLGTWARALLCALFLASSAPAVHAAAAPIPALAPGQFRGKLFLVALQERHRPMVREGRQLWALAKPISYRTHAGDLITVPAGMVTDLASIPSFISPILPPDGPWSQAAVFHDLCYASKGTFEWRARTGHIRGPPYSRLECDQLLRDGMSDLGITGWRNWSIFEGVRLGGSGGWGK